MVDVCLRTKWLWVRTRCCHLNFRYGACFEQGVPWHSDKPKSVDSLWRSYMTCEFCEISKNKCFYRTPPVAASVHNRVTGIREFSAKFIFRRCFQISPLSPNLIKSSSRLKTFVDCCRQFVWVCLAILWG